MVAQSTDDVRLFSLGVNAGVEVVSANFAWRQASGFVDAALTEKMIARPTAVASQALLVLPHVG